MFNDPDNDFENNKLTILDSVSVIRNPSSDDQLANGKYVDESLDSDNVLKFNQTLQHYLKSIRWKGLF